MLRLEDFYEQNGKCIHCSNTILTPGSKYYCSRKCIKEFPANEACLVKKHGKSIPELLKWSISQTKRDAEAAELIGVSKNHFGNLKKKYLAKNAELSALEERLEVTHKKPIRQLLVETLNSHPTLIKAAKALTISQGCLRNCMKKHDIRMYFE